MKQGYVFGGLMLGGATAVLAGLQANDQFVTKAVTGTLQSYTHYLSDASIQVGALIFVAGLSCIALAGLILMIATVVAQVEEAHVARLDKEFGQQISAGLNSAPRYDIGLRK